MAVQTTIVCLCCLHTEDVLGLDRSNLLFYASFNESFDADIARGNGTATVEGTVERIPGRDADAPDILGPDGTPAVKFTSKGDVLRYNLADNLQLSQGAVAFWVYEVDTEKDQRIWNPYVQVMGEDEVLNVLRLWQGIAVVGGLWRADEKVAYAGGPVGNRGTWQHVVYTWRNHEMAMYVNGKGKRVANLDFQFLNPPDSFTIGRPENPTANADDFHTGEHLLKDAPEKAREMQIGTEPYGAYLLDDIAIFNKYLSEEEAKAVFEKPLEEALRSDAAGEPTLNILSYASSARVRIDAHFYKPLPADAEVTARVVREDGSATGISAPVAQTARGFEYAYLDVKELAPGRYGVKVTATHDGEPIAHTQTVAFERIEPEEWMTNTYGADDVVLPGFKPLKADGTVVSMWGRTYDFNAGIMPVQITNQEYDMLARPINWVVDIGGETHHLVTDSMELVSSSDTRARYRGKGTLGTITVMADVMVEYDGFMKFDLTFDPGAGGAEIEQLRMDVPLVPAQSTNLFHPTRRSGSWQNDWTSSLRLTKTNIVTLGTPDISLQWLTASDEHYYPRGHGQALQGVEEDGARVFRTNVIGEKKRVKTPFTLTFALHAGPVRPRPQGWRGWTFQWGGSLPNHGRKHLDPEHHMAIPFSYDFWARTPGSVIPRNGFPEDVDQEFLRGKICMTSMHFGGFRHFEEKDPEKRLPVWDKYEAEWQRIPRRIKKGSAPGWNEQRIDPNSTWGQWHIYNVYKLMSRTGARGFYYDDWLPPVSKNEAAGSGYIDENGIRRPINPIFSQRELHRRVYALVKQHRPDDGFVMIHTASSILLPIVSFCDMIYDGEIMQWVDHRPPDGEFFETFKDSYFQMIFSCKNYGPVGGFHDESTLFHKRAWSIHNQRQLWAKYLTHDIHSYGGHRTGADELLYFYLDHGFPLTDPGVRFHGYWRPNPAVRALKAYWPSTGNVDGASLCLVSAYSKRGGQALIVVVRDSPKAYGGSATVHVKLDRDKLRLPMGELASTQLESLGRRPLGNVEGDILKVPVGANDFSAVIVQKKE
ncbi:MAG: LamG domain-containing protein [Candidatus Pacebacteria bacterium]|nr:LamG domain-containing protein [Candidatus Paceibacterota bacterium]